MKSTKLLLGLALISLAGSALAGEDVRMKIAVAVVDDASGDETRFEINTKDLGFDLHDMQEGENRSIIDESGRNILITRENDGFTLNIDGKIIELPALLGEHHGMLMAGDGDGDLADMDVRVMHHGGPMAMHGLHEMDDTMIISPKPIDDATQQAIKSLLESAGYGSDVSFIDRQAAHGGRIRIKRIEKTVENQ